VRGFGPAPLSTGRYRARGDGGTGSDNVAAGAGNDVVDVFDGARSDIVTYGSGIDTVYADPGDIVALTARTSREPLAPSPQPLFVDVEGPARTGGALLDVAPSDVSTSRAPRRAWGSP
jgi:Ca2+-binding RTX toxin-like protein